jgi:hypothetical protein
VCCWTDILPVENGLGWTNCLMYHGLTFSTENGPGLTFSCGTDGDLIRMNGFPPMAQMVT